MWENQVNEIAKIPQGDFGDEDTLTPPKYNIDKNLHNILKSDIFRYHILYDISENSKYHEESRYINDIDNIPVLLEIFRYNIC